MSNIFYTDGACSSNGYSNASGGWGVVEIDKNNNIVWKKQGFKSPTTNNEMELMAIKQAVEHIVEKENNNIPFIKPIIYTDSAYCFNIINNWMFKWANNGWKRPRNEEIKNLQIIQDIYKFYDFFEIRKIPGHNGIEWNEYADKLATGRIKI